MTVAHVDHLQPVARERGRKAVGDDFFLEGHAAQPCKGDNCVRKGFIGCSFQFLARVRSPVLRRTRPDGIAMSLDGSDAGKSSLRTARKLRFQANLAHLTDSGHASLFTGRFPNPPSSAGGEDRPLSCASATLAANGAARTGASRPGLAVVIELRSSQRCPLQVRARPANCPLPTAARIGKMGPSGRRAQAAVSGSRRLRRVIRLSRWPAWADPIERKAYFVGLCQALARSGREVQ